MGLNYVESCHSRSSQLEPNSVWLHLFSLVHFVFLLLRKTYSAAAHQTPVRTTKRVRNRKSRTTEEITIVLFFELLGGLDNSNGTISDNILGGE